MKIAILTDTPPMKLGDQGEYCGRGWIDSFIGHLARVKDVNIFVLYNSRLEKNPVQLGDVRYIPVRNSLTYPIKALNVLPRQLGIWERKSDIGRYVEIIGQINPDVIHIFGTEWIGIRLLQYSFRNILVHIQGFASVWHSYLYVHTKASRNELIKGSFQTTRSLLWGLSLIHQHQAMRCASRRERVCLKEVAFYAGRTNFDRQVIREMNPAATYFHLDELLRDGFYKADTWYPQSGKDRLVFVSTLSDRIYKGLDFVAEVCRILDKQSSLQIEWCIVGIDEKSDSWRLFGKNRNLRNIRIIPQGVQREEKLISLLQNCDAYIHPSRIENSPNSLCEAQILGVPVIARNTGGVPSLVRNGETGILFKDMSELVSIIEQIPKQAEKLAEIGQQGRLRALIRHQPAKIIADTLSAYQQIIAEK